MDRGGQLRDALRIAADYFPDALIELAKVCRAGNKQHNGDSPVLYWDRSKSTDHFTKGIRHWTRRGFRDDDGTRHIGKASWRALADCQLECERSGAPVSPAAIRLLHDNCPWPVELIAASSYSPITPATAQRGTPVSQLDEE